MTFYYVLYYNPHLILSTCILLYPAKHCPLSQNVEIVWARSIDFSTYAQMIEYEMWKNRENYVNFFYSSHLTQISKMCSITVLRRNVFL